MGSKGHSKSKERGRQKEMKNREAGQGREHMSKSVSAVRAEMLPHHRGKDPSFSYLSHSSRQSCIIPEQA
jgi:hypothetical protein